MFDSLFRRRISLEAQLQTLANCGIRASEGYGLDYFLGLFGREAYEKTPYRVLLCALGSETEQEPYQPVSGNVWHLDTECIEDHGDYVRIAGRMALLGGDALKLENIADYVDVEEGRASLSFVLRGQEFKWEPKVDHDWIDAAILSQFARLLEKQ